MVYTTPDYVAQELRLSGFTDTTTPSLATVNRWIEEVKDIIDNLTHNTWELTEVTEYYDYTGSGELILRNAPVISIVSLEYEKNGLGADTEDWVTLEEGRTKDFIVYKDEGVIKFISDNKPSQGYQNIKVTYQYGYSTVPGTVQRLATLMVAKQVILSLKNQEVNSEGGTVSVGDITVSDPSIFSVKYLDSLDKEIQNLLEVLGTSKLYIPFKR